MFKKLNLSWAKIVLQIKIDDKMNSIKKGWENQALGLLPLLLFLVLDNCFTYLQSFLVSDYARFREPGR